MTFKNSERSGSNESKRKHDMVREDPEENAKLRTISKELGSSKDLQSVPHVRHTE